MRFPDEKTAEAEALHCAQLIFYGQQIFHCIVGIFGGTLYSAGKFGQMYIGHCRVSEVKYAN